MINLPKLSKKELTIKKRKKQINQKQEKKDKKNPQNPIKSRR